MSKPGWVDLRDGAGVRRITLCDGCAAKLPTLPKDTAFGVLSGRCDGCGAGFCACYGTIGCTTCPRKAAKAIASRLRVYMQATE